MAHPSADFLLVQLPALGGVTARVGAADEATPEFAVDPGIREIRALEARDAILHAVSLGAAV